MASTSNVGTVNMDEPSSKKPKLQLTIPNAIDLVLQCINKVPRLEHMAGIAIISDLWCRQIKQLNYDSNFARFHIMRAKVMNTIRKLIVSDEYNILLPDWIAEKLLFCSNSIGNSIAGWIEHIHTDCISTKDLAVRAENYVEFIVWTPAGMISYLETAKSLLEYSDLDVGVKFLIASNYCLIDYLALYEQMVDMNARKRTIGNNVFARYWMSAKRGILRTPYEDLFIEIILKQKNGCAESLKYFWNVLTAEEKGRCADTWSGSIRLSNFSDYAVAKFFLECLYEIEMNERILAGFTQKRESTTRIFQFFIGLCNHQVYMEFLEKVFFIIADLDMPFADRRYTEFHSVADKLLRLIDENRNNQIGDKYMNIFKTFLSYIPEKFVKYIMQSTLATRAVHSFAWENHIAFAINFLKNIHLSYLRYNMLHCEKCIKSLSRCVSENVWDDLKGIIKERLSPEEWNKLKKKVLMERFFDVDFWSELKIVLVRVLDMSSDSDDFPKLCDAMLALCNETDNVNGIRACFVILYAKEIAKEYDRKSRKYRSELDKCLEWYFNREVSSSKRISKQDMLSTLLQFLNAEKDDIVSIKYVQKFVGRY